MCSALGRARRHTDPTLAHVHLLGGSELPVVHLQLFQVCHQAEESTVILTLAALESGDGGHRTK